MNSNFPNSRLRPFYRLIPAIVRTRLFRKRGIRSTLQVGLGMILGVLILAYVSAGEIYEYHDSVDGVHLPPVDAIVCLAGGRGRIAAAGDVWYRYWETIEKDPAQPAIETPRPAPPILYISGMGRYSNWNVLARQVRRGVLQVLKPQHVALETESSNTEENALWLARYAKEKGWKKILLVTSRYHMKRARLIFDHVLKVEKIPLAVETLSVYQEPFEPGEWRSGLHGVRVTMEEYGKWLYYKYLWLP